MFLVEVFWVVTSCSVVEGYERLRGPRFTLKTKAEWASEALVPYHNPEDLTLNHNCRESLKTRVYKSRASLITNINIRKLKLYLINFKVKRIRMGRN
jgi:hypothetical protein